MADLLLKLANRGEVAAAQSLALDLLRRPFDASGKRALLSAVAGTLAMQHVDPSGFDALPLAARLTALRDDRLVGGGVAELLLLYRGTTDRNAYRWWREGGPDPRFTALISDVGSSAKDRRAAEAYFRLALEYSDGRSADAFVELANLLYAQKRIGELESLTRQYQEAMFDAKGMAIAARDYGAEYRFHVALGTMYAYLDRWGSEGEPASAIYQLTQAQRAAEDYNRGLTWGPKIPTDSKTVELLATCYTKTNQNDRAVALRIDTAEAFAAEGRKTAANGLLKPIRANPAVIRDPAYRKRYATVNEKLSQKIEIGSEVGFPDAIDVRMASLEPTASQLPAALGKQIMSAIANYVLAESDYGRDKAEAELKKLGVSNLDPTTMSRTTGEFVVKIDGKPVRYRYTVKTQ